MRLSCLFPQRFCSLIFPINFVNSSSRGGFGIWRRDSDEVLFNHFARKSKEEYKINVSQNAKASLSLGAACEKLKKVLSENPVATLKVECNALISHGWSFFFFFADWFSHQKARGQTLKWKWDWSCTESSLLNCWIGNCKFFL